MKNTLFYVFISVFVLAATTYAHHYPVPCERCDINKDGRITATDSLIALRASVGLGCQ